MNDELLAYYDNELAFMRNLAAEFAQDHAGVADLLNLNSQSGQSQDPHVERLIQAFALLAARVRKKLDDEFPEVVGALLDVLYPHAQAPLPSMAVVELQLDRQQGAALTDGYPIPRGEQLETESVEGEACYYRTCYPVLLFPFDVTEASLGQTPLGLSVKGTSSVLRIKLRCFSPEMKFSQLKLKSLRFFLSGQSQHVLGLYELLFNHLLTATVATPGPPGRGEVLGRVDVRPLGFEEDEAALPFTLRSHPAYRLLTEYFAFPQKFYFFEIAGVSEKVLAGAGNELEFNFYFDVANPDLERNISRASFRLGCTPIINLFPQRADPIRLTQEQTKYRVVPDRRRSPEACEIYSIESVVGTTASGQMAVYEPFYSLRHATDRANPRFLWCASRSESSRAEHQVNSGSEIYLSLVDLAFKPAAPADWTVEAETICFNRDLPSRLPSGGDRPRLGLSQGGPVSAVRCLIAPTPTRRREADLGIMWRLISHLSLNHLSLAGGPEGADALREILRLHDFVGSPETLARLAGILSVKSRRITSRLQTEEGEGVCRGLQVQIEIDEARYPDNGLFLFASVLERFLELYASVNSFVQLSLLSHQSGRIVKTWKPRIKNLAAA